MHPDIFYKYTSASTALKVLKTTRLRWSSPFLFDDPAEFKRMPRFDPSIDEVVKTFPTTIVQAAIGKLPIREQDLTEYARDLIAMTRFLINSGMIPTELITEISNFLEGSDNQFEANLLTFFNEPFISTARVLCVSTTFDNDALWASYGDKFKGCTLGFRHIPELSTPLLAARKVVYSEESPVAGSGTDYLLYGSTDKLRRSILDAVCFTKQNHWSNQQEWRVVNWKEEENDAKFGDYSFYSKELESVTLGMLASEEVESTIADLLSTHYPDCQLYRLLQEGDAKKRVPVIFRRVGA